MSYLIYNVKTSILLNRNQYKTVGAARTALTKSVNKGKIVRFEYAIADVTEFYKNIDKQVDVRNLMSGGIVKQSINTPLCCDVSSETYWSM